MSKGVDRGGKRRAKAKMTQKKNAPKAQQNFDLTHQKMLFLLNLMHVQHKIVKYCIIYLFYIIHLIFCKFLTP